MQRAYSLVLGQCTELLRAKLKQSTDWATVSIAFDVLGLTRLIKAIVFKFDDQKFLPVSLHQAKQNFYNLRQGAMTNAEYLEKYNNGYPPRILHLVRRSSGSNMTYRTTLGHCLVN